MNSLSFFVFFFRISFGLPLCSLLEFVRFWFHSEEIGFDILSSFSPVGHDFSEIFTEFYWVYWVFFLTTHFSFFFLFLFLGIWTYSVLFDSNQNWFHILGFYKVGHDFSGFYLVLLGFTGFYRVWLGFIGFDLVLPISTGFYLVLPSFTEFYLVLPNFT